MTDPRLLALAHEERLREQGLEAFRRMLLDAVERTGDVNAAMELQHAVEKINLAIASSEAVRRHLEAAQSVKEPSFEMIDRLTTLLGELDEARRQTQDAQAWIDLARQKNTQFRMQVDYTRALGK